ncbi:uncharacterized protein LOC128713038 [Anopheles marshallii]|uniref:uncharacterized protein LOC128713038 n=1 Tax=Anopheles marshallii TaxID=1521116 RepID=UPI00237A654C|nr:uncharacterized protein LOC128713038 [Anopheles marshallii]
MKKMKFKVILMLGLLGLILVLLFLLDLAIRFVTAWLFGTGIISWIFSFGPEFMSNIVFATVQAVLLNWTLTSLLCLITHVKVQRMTLSENPDSSTLKLELLFVAISYNHRGIDTKIRSIQISLDIDPNVSPWISITIIDPCVTKCITRETFYRNVNSVPTHEPQTAVPKLLEWLLNIKHGGLLQILLRHVKFCVTNGTLEVRDWTSKFQLSVRLHCKEFGLREHSSIHEDAMYTDAYKQLYVRKFTAKIFVQPNASATFHCSFFSLHVAYVDRVRGQPYNSKAMNILLGRQYWKFDVWISLVCFYLGTGELDENVRERGEIFFARQIDITLANMRSKTQETGKLKMKVELPICMEYRPELAHFIINMFRCIAHFRPVVADNRGQQAMVPVPTSQQTFPAALDMVIDVTLGKVSCLLWNEHNTCLLVNWKKLTMQKLDGDTVIRLHTLAMQMGDYSEFTNAECGNEKLTVDEIIIKHGDDNAYYQDLFIDLKNPITTWNKDVHNHVKQLIEEMKTLTAKLTRLMPPPSRPGKRVTICVSLFGTVRFLLPLTTAGPTVKIETRKIKVSNAGKDYLCVWDAVIYVGIARLIIHEYLCFESEDRETRGGWIMTTHNKHPFEINKTTLYKVVFNGFVPIYKWLQEWW